MVKKILTSSFHSILPFKIYNQNSHLHEIQIVVSIPLPAHPIQLQFDHNFQSEDNRLSYSTSERILVPCVCLMYSSVHLVKDNHYKIKPVIMIEVLKANSNIPIVCFKTQNRNKVLTNRIG